MYKEKIIEMVNDMEDNSFLAKIYTIIRIHTFKKELKQEGEKNHE